MNPVTRKSGVVVRASALASHRPASAIVPNRRLGSFVSLWLAVAIGGGALIAQQGPIPGQNVNMVSGTEWPDGDPFLQRQNEGSIAVSTRNPLHLLGGANDYRTVDIPGLPDGAMSGDAWNGVFWSRDGGHKWKSTLLPGYPQDTSAAGLASPIHGLQAGADPVVRAGANGMMFYVGIAFNRDAITQEASGGGKTGKLFLARFIDDNAKETGNPFRHLDTLIVDNGSDGKFLDKPWLAVAKPEAGGGACSIPGDGGGIGSQTFPAGNVYVAYTIFVSNNPNFIRTKVMFARSGDCGKTWQTQKLSEGYPVNQGASIAIDPASGAVYVAWRRFKTDKGDADGFLIAKSVDGGKSFTKAVEIASFVPYTLADGTQVSQIFEQGTSIASFRTTGFPALAVDPNGIVYAAWSQRGIGPSAAARIMMKRSVDGVTWTEPAFPVDNSVNPGHQVMPSMMFHAGKIDLTYYNLVEDHTVGQLTPGTFTETRDPAGDLATAPPQPEKVFWDFIADFAPAGLGPLKRRHTIDLWIAEANPAGPGTPMGLSSTRVSQYVYGDDPHPPPGLLDRIVQYQFNPPNLPLFACGGVLANCKAFFSDYIDLAGAPSLVSTPGGGWEYNLSPSSSRVLHAIWTDNRDVRPPPDGNWHLYTPPNSPFSSTLGGNSLFDPNQARPACEPSAPGFTRAGMRNQNVYTARITQGLVAGSPQNSKPLGLTTIDGNTVLLQRAFVVFVQNTTGDLKTFRLTIANQPADAPSPGKASFLQFATPPLPDPLTELFVRVPAKSTATRTVFVTSGIRNASVSVLVEEFSGLPADGGALVPPDLGGLQSTVVLNPDITNPDITNPDITNPDITNPDITNAEVYNPDITNPDITNPDITNPDITNPDITNPDITNPDITNPDITNVQVMNPDITNPDITNPDITNPDITNPDITNPDITNPDITNGTVVEATWTITDTGNTTAGYKVKLLVNGHVPADFKTQLIIHRGYSTPVAVGCDLAVQRQSILIANIPNPEFINLLSPDITNPDITNPDITNATLWVGPGDDWAQITLRIVDTDPLNGPTPEEFLSTTVTPAVVAQAVNTLEAAAGSTTPPVAVPSTSIVFIVPPSAGTVDQPISPTVQVQVRDDQGAVIPGATVTLSVFSGPGGAEIGGNVATTDAVGIASFPALTLSPAGVYTLAAIVGVPEGVTSPAPAFTAPFLVLEACAADGQASVTHSVVEGPDVGSEPVAARQADFDGDAYVDMVVIHANGTITKMSGDGPGNFTRRFQFTIPIGEAILTGPTSVAVGDFNGDGLSDFVVAYPAQDRLGIVLSDPDNPAQYFTAAPTSILYGGGPRSLAVGHFRNSAGVVDGNLDVAVAITDVNSVSIAFGDGAGGFPASGTIADTFGPAAVAAADMDGDGLTDVVVANRGVPGEIAIPSSVQILLGSLFFDAVPAVDSDPVGVDPRAVAIGDFNGDGIKDVAVASAGSNDVDVPVSGDVRVFFGDGAGNLTSAAVITLPGAPRSVTVGDFNSDGFLDLAIANGANFLMFFNDGTGTFGAPETFPAGTTPVDVSAGDVNGDGRTDLVITNQQPDDSGNDTISVLISHCGATTADLAVSMTDAPDPVAPGQTVTYETTVTNTGPFAATGVTLTGKRSAGTLLSVSPSQGSCTAMAPVTCDLGTLAPGASATVTAEIVAPLEGSAINVRTTARAAEVDRLPGNNTARETTAVVGAMTFFVTTTADSGPGSFRQAILNANANAGFTDTILFNIPGQGPHTITPLSALPAITDPVLIDAPTTGECAGAPPTIEIDGSSAGLSHGLFVSAGGTTIRGLAITNFASSEFAGIFLAGGGSSVVECSYLGLAPDGTTVKGNFDGIRIGGSFNNTIGGTTAAVRNVISGNIRNGVLVMGPVGGVSGSVMQNLVQGNFIGTDATGTLDRGNASNGVHLINSASNTIGGAAAARNVISGNNGEGVRIDGATATENVIQGNYIGTSASGTVDLGNGASGVYIRRAPGNTVVGNVVSGNDLFAGVAICGNAGFCGGGDVGTQGSDASGNLVQGNLIGTDASGTIALGNAGRGVSIDGAPNTLVGGTTVAARNVISANGLFGVVISAAGATGNQILGNYIGTDAAGASALGNAFQGVWISAAPSNVVGGPTVAERNVISGNGSAGVQVINADGNVVQRNFIGTDATGAAAVGNAGPGVLLQGTTNTVIGTVGGGPGPAPNVISGNAHGVRVEGAAASNNQLQGNLIGTNAAGDAAIPNAGVGVIIAAGPVNTSVGGSVISGNGSHGVWLQGAAPGTFIGGSRIGTNVLGTAALGNGGEGILLEAAATVGGTFAGARNVVGGNGLNGIRITGNGALVLGNYIGVDDDGAPTLPNASAGISLGSGASNTTIGGTTAAARNVISGNTFEGIVVTAGASNNVVEGNLIGTNAAGDAAVGNGTTGVVVLGPNNVIGGSTTAARNVISGNTQCGVSLQGASATGNLVRANYIGANAAGTGAVANGTCGVHIFDAAGNTIGGTFASERNVIAGNTAFGIEIAGAGAVNNVVRGNEIGVMGLGNGSHGVFIHLGASNNTISGNLNDRTAPNDIRQNAGDGIRVVSGTGNLLRINRIDENQGLGIDLGGDVVTANDAGDGDAGANDLQNFPVLDSASGDGSGGVTIRGTLSSSPNTLFDIDFFHSPSCDGSGNGEGRTWFGGLSATTTPAGLIDFSNGLTFLGVGVPVGSAVTTIATNSGGSTSEFSACVTVTIGALTFTVTNTNDSGAGSLRQALLNANANAGFTDTIAFNIPGTAPHTIAPTSAMPAITDPVIIDGTSGAGCSGSAPTIEIDGTAAGPAVALRIDSPGNSIVRGLAITNFGLAAIFLNGGGSNLVVCNYLGVAPDGVTAKGNNEGVLVAGSASNTIGGTSALVRNVISANLAAGINIGAAASTGNQVLGNFIGTDVTGTLDRGNAGSGVFISNASTNVVGGTAAGARNLISGNNAHGVTIAGTSSGNAIEGNYIGTNAAGTGAIGNGSLNAFLDLVGAGVNIDGAPTNTVGGTTPGAGNLISGNGTGISINGAAASANVVQGNLIGTTATGSAALGNRWGMFIVDAPNTTIGGTTEAARNVISGNSQYGIQVNGAAGTQIQGNYIGTNAAGTADLGNTFNGVYVAFGATVQIGGATAGAGNVVSGNNGAGIRLETSGNIVQANWIGAGADGALDLGNGGSGISLSSVSDNVIGGASNGEPNVVAFNDGGGISISGGIRNAIRKNAIFSNGNAEGGIGIDLGGDGVTVNDAGDADEGANNLQNFPVVTSASSVSGSTTIEGSLNSTANTTVVIDFFVSPSCDPSDHGEGQTWIGTLADVATDADGALVFSSTIGIGLTAGTVVTATVTDSAGNTSEFSACQTVTGG